MRYSITAGTVPERFAVVSAKLPRYRAA